MSSHPRDHVVPALVIGGGPVGLAAAAHLHREGRQFLVVEAGPEVGHAVRRWGHVRLFTPWKYLVDGAAQELLEASGWSMPDPRRVPTGRELVEAYLKPLASLPELSARILLNTRVVAIARRGLDKAKTVGRGQTCFDVRTLDPDANEHRFLADAVIDASGTYDSPNPMGSNGIEAPGEAAVAKRTFYGIPDVRARDRSRYAGRRVGVVGSGHSAFNTLLDLEELVVETGTTVTWFVRSANLTSVWGGGEADALPERGALDQRMKWLAESGRVAVREGFAVDGVRSSAEGARLVSSTGEVSRPLDEIVVVTGFRPNLRITGELRLDLDSVVEAPSRLAPLIDPNLHSCGTVPPHGHRELSHPEPGYYAVGMKSYGRAPTFLLLTGYEQVRSVVKALVGDLDAADRVELLLPETGVCNTDLTLVGAGAPTVGSSCCG